VATTPVRPRRLRHVRHDLRYRIREREDQGGRGHGPDHFRRQDARGRAAKEDVRASDDIGEAPRVGLLRVTRLVRLQVRLATGVDHAPAVADEDMLALHAEPDHKVEAGDGRRASTRAGDLDPADVLADDP